MSENVIKLHLKKTNHSCIEDLVADSRGIADALAKITEDIAIKKAEAEKIFGSDRSGLK